MRINSYKELKSVLGYEKMHLQRIGAYPTFGQKVVREHKYLLMKYIRLLRYDEYFSNKKNLVFMLPCVFVKIRRNRLGALLGVLIPNYTCEQGVVIWHYNVIVNAYAKIGKNVQFHGNNCIGNKGGDHLEAPVLGDDIDIGIGAKVIGGVHVSDSVKIGANAVVTRDFNRKGSILVGIPAESR